VRSANSGGGLKIVTSTDVTIRSSPMSPSTQALPAGSASRQISRSLKLKLKLK
jgi:hypothetical protein